MMRRTAWTVGGVLAWAAVGAPGGVVYVDRNATGSVDGLTWETAWRDPRSALAAAAAGDEIRIADGVYRPNEGPGPTDRSATFEILKGLTIRGGFAGAGAANPDLQDPNVHPTILDGDLLGNDDPNFVNYGDNARTVVTWTGSAEGTLEAVTVRGGAGALPGARAGGLDASTPGSAQRSLALRRCRFVANRGGSGGGVFVADWNLLISECRFEGNRAEGQSGSGGLGLDYKQPRSVEIRDSYFSGNRAPEGFGALGRSTPVATIEVTGCTFEGNSGRILGGADATSIRASTFLDNRGTGPIGGTTLPVVGGACGSSFEDCAFVGNNGMGGGAIGGAIGSRFVRCNFSGNIGTGLFLTASLGTGVASDCVFSDNTADFSGGLTIEEPTPGGINFYIVRCIFERNTAGRAGAAYLGGTGARPHLVNCQFIGNRALEQSGALRSNRVQAARISNCLFVDNDALAGGAAIDCAGTRMVVHGCTFAGNDVSAAFEATVRFNILTGGPGLEIGNCIFWDNRASGVASQGAQIHTQSLGEVRHNLIDGWTGTAGYSHGGNFAADPMFVDPVGPDGVPWSGDEDLRLQAGSSAIDRGWNMLAPIDTADLDGDGDFTELTPLDLDGRPRFVEDAAPGDAGCGGTAIVDLGPYEFNPLGGLGGPPCLFDSDGDGLRGEAELAAVLAAFGSTGGQPRWSCAGDVDADLDVDLDDLLIVLGRYGEACPNP